MKKFLLLLLFTATLACSEKTDEKQSDAYIPELVITDSLVIDRLTELGMIDVKEDHSEYLFFDWKKDELLRISEHGEVLASANRSEDGRDSFKARYFTTADYYGEDEILITTHAGIFIYDLDFILKEEKPLDFSLVTHRIGGSNAAEVYKNYLYTFSVDNDSGEKVYNSEEFSTSYPFMTLRDINSLDIIKSQYIPEQSLMAITPGQYNSLDPIVRFIGDEIFALFPNSPELYVYDLPSFEFKSFQALNPGDQFKKIQPVNRDINFDGFFKSLASSQYTNYAFSNGYLLTQYEGAAPQDEVDALPKNVVGGSDFEALVKKYKEKQFYQIFKGEEKLWEGTWDVNLWSVRDVLFSNAKPGEDPEAIEKDVQTIYFYELK
ncbi:hypothetical protein [Algoriphagus winogradskyi]|uniref:6-bladed beta-propeller protein n=1 Tax=Algoriphagus winogradskyi TaxID=237017 RepID=A0ABY1NDN8_9BACT|nr:hypothetical protein [Algoriphagus winogradskyi]SMP07069.1 hypothetical protein SAMN06265367_101547 [Algoriphagus winogradskyi]